MSRSKNQSRKTLHYSSSSSGALSARELRYLQKERRLRQTNGVPAAPEEDSNNTTTERDIENLSEPLLMTAVPEEQSLRRRQRERRRQKTHSPVLHLMESSSSSTHSSAASSSTVIDKEEPQQLVKKRSDPFLENALVVSEESCLSDHSSCSNSKEARKIAQKKQKTAKTNTNKNNKKKAAVVHKKSPRRATKHGPTPRLPAVKKRDSIPKEEEETHAKRHRMKANLFKPTDVQLDRHAKVPSASKQSDNVDESLKQPPLKGTAAKVGAREKRQRVSTNFYNPAAAANDDGKRRRNKRERNDETDTALAVRREKRHRAAPSFYRPAPVMVGLRHSKAKNSTINNNERLISSRTRPNNRHVVFADEQAEASSSTAEESSSSSRRSCRKSEPNRRSTRSASKTDAAADGDESSGDNDLKRRLRSSAPPHEGEQFEEQQQSNKAARLPPEVQAASAVVAQLHTVNHAVSLDSLLTRYERLARTGNVDPVHFGTNIYLAQTAIERKLKELAKKFPDDAQDLEVIEDIKEYKRSLRVFKYFEDQEKLALEEEYEEVVEAWRRGAAVGRRKIGAAEEANLASRPLIFSRNKRLPARKSQCPPTKQCGFCHYHAPSQQEDSTASRIDALIPGIRKIDPDADDEEGKAALAEPKKKAPKTSVRPRVSTRSVDVMVKVRATRQALSELQHSLTFVDEYAAGLLP